MHERYSQKDIKFIWSEENKFNKFLKIEIESLKTLVKLDKIPSDILLAVNSIVIDKNRISEIEEKTHHDFLAFTTSIEEQLPKDLQRYFHFGLTSSDVIDTSLMLQLKETSVYIKQELNAILAEVLIQIESTKNLLCVGRTHGVFAEPMVFADKWLSFYCEFKRCLKDLDDFEFSGQLSGAIGNHAILGKEFEDITLSALNLQVEESTTQVIPRDRIVRFVNIVNLISLAIERASIEFRHLQHSDVSEVFEGFSAGQKGSSIMPHKKNPIGFENLTSVCRVLQSYPSIAVKNCSLWHERDLSNSASERIYLPEMSELVTYALRRFKDTIKNINYDRVSIEQKIENNINIFSSRVLHELLENTKLSRSKVYKEVQSIFFKCHDFKSLKLELNQSFKYNPSFNKKTIRHELTEKFNNQLQNIIANNKGDRV